MRALITAGGTVEPIDDVRVLTNLSTGRLGAAIANALAARGLDVTLLASRALMERPEWVDARVQRVGFGSAADLAARLDEHLGRSVDLVFMAAAVADYSPVPHAGKLSSEQDELVLRLRRNPKLLPTLRPRCGPGAFLVGFKLLSGVTRDELRAVARRQIRGAALDATFANDLQQLRAGRHPAWLVETERDTELSGDKDAVARALVDHCTAALVDRRGPTIGSRGASVALLSPDGRVLIGRRLVGPLRDHHSFPGGRIEAGESPLRAARRELAEETGIDAGAATPVARVDVIVPDPARAAPWVVSCHVLQLADTPPPRASEELEARWVPLPEAAALRPLAPGIAAVLTRIADL